MDNTIPFWCVVEPKVTRKVSLNQNFTNKRNKGGGVKVGHRLGYIGSFITLVSQTDLYIKSISTDYGSGRKRVFSPTTGRTLMKTKH